MASAPSASVLPSRVPYHNVDVERDYGYFVSCDDLPFATPSSVPGIGGTIKHTPRDFYVEELGADSHADGIVGRSGACHIFLTITREGLNTAEVQRRLAAIVGCEPFEVGLCGRKDRHARTTQTFSVPSFCRRISRHVTPEELRGFVEDAHRGILSVKRVAVSSTKLRRNMHLGNRFRIAVRGLDPTIDTGARVRDILSHLRQAGGIPNYYGVQRFGKGSRCALRGARLLQSLQVTKSGTKRKRACVSLNRSMIKQLCMSAYSSMMFNIWLGRRITAGLFGQLLDGDLVAEAWVQKNNVTGGGSCAAIRAQGSSATPAALSTNMGTAATKATESVGTQARKKSRKKHKKARRGPGTNYLRLERVAGIGDTPGHNSSSSIGASTTANTFIDRFARGEIDYTGPMPGARLLSASGGTPAHKLESSVLELSNISEKTFKAAGMWGTRRRARLLIKDLQFKVEKENSTTLVFSFSLPPGSYATTVLREFMKVSLSDQLPEHENSMVDETNEGEHGAGGGELKHDAKRRAAPAQQAPWQPLTQSECIKFLAAESIPFLFASPSASGEQAPGCKTYFTKSKRGKKLCLSILATEDRSSGEVVVRSIADISTALGYKQSARLAPEKVVSKVLHCNPAAIGPISVIGVHGIFPQVAPTIAPTGDFQLQIAIDTRLVEDDGRVLWLQIGEAEAPIGLKVPSYVQLLTSCGAKPVFVKF